MKRIALKVTKIGDLTYLPAPEINEPEGIFRRRVTFVSDDYPIEEQDEIIATLWDDNALLDLKIGDKVLAFLQFRVGQTTNGFSYQTVDLELIKKISDY